MAFHRCALMFLTVVLLSPRMAPAQSPSIGQRMVNYLESQKGKAIGGGECAHVASEALRRTGGEFIRSDIGQDNPRRNDYVWGTLVTVIESVNGRLTDSLPANRAQPGDVLQFRDVVLSVPGGGYFTYKHHTAVVAAVNAAGRPIQVYQQNLTFNGKNTRILRKDDMNFSRLTGGWVRIYRPKPRTDKPGQFKYAVVNRTPGRVNYAIKSGTFELAASTLDVNNTAGSYANGWYTVSGTRILEISLPSGPSIKVENAAGYEVYSPAKGVLGIRKMTD